MKITVIGTGGCLNSGLPYNAFLLDEHFLIDAPPDIMPSLHAAEKEVNKIDTLFLSHMHGDHTFGIPFIIINKWLQGMNNSSSASLSVIGPEGIEAHVRSLTELAFTTSHPCYEWLDRHVRFTGIKAGDELPFDSMKISFFELDHPVQSYGLVISMEDQGLFAYIADTTWCRSVEEVLLKKPNTVFIDMNGGNIHISYDDVRNRAIPLTDNETTYYGVHLWEAFEPKDERIKCPRPGEEIRISCRVP